MNPGQVVFAFGVGVVVAALALNGVFQRRLRQQYAALAAARGWQYTPGDPYGCVRLPFAILGRGRRQSVDHTLALQLPNGRPARVFAFRTTVGSGKSQHVERYSCVVIDTGDRFPALTIEHEGVFGRLRDSIGMHDIQFESEEFNRTFKIESDDLRFAHAVIDQRFMAMLLDHPTNAVAIALHGPYCLTWCSLQQPERAPAMIEFTDMVRHAVPAVVRELYPPA